jgi:hypothetical protein
MGFSPRAKLWDLYEDLRVSGASEENVHRLKGNKWLNRNCELYN